MMGAEPPAQRTDHTAPQANAPFSWNGETTSTGAPRSYRNSPFRPHACTNVPLLCDGDVTFPVDAAYRGNTSAANCSVPRPRPTTVLGNADHSQNQPGHRWATCRTGGPFLRCRSCRGGDI
jgi:hypothetical protein